VQGFVIDLDSELSKWPGRLRSFHEARSPRAGQAGRGVWSQAVFMKKVSCAMAFMIKAIACGSELARDDGFIVHIPTN